MYALANGRWVLAAGAVVMALALHVWAWRIGRDWRRQWAAEQETQRQNLKAKDWDAIEAEEQRLLDEAERDMNAETDRQPGKPTA